VPRCQWTSKLIRSRFGKTLGTSSLPQPSGKYQYRIPVRRRYQLLLENFQLLYWRSSLQRCDARAFFESWDSCGSVGWKISGRRPVLTVPIRSLVTVDLCATSLSNTFFYHHTNYIRRRLLLSLYLLLGYSEFRVIFSLLEAMLTCLSAMTGSQSNYVPLDFGLLKPDWQLYPDVWM
jgi:hypothetical protein